MAIITTVVGGALAGAYLLGELRKLLKTGLFAKDLFKGAGSSDCNSGHEYVLRLLNTGDTDFAEQALKYFSKVPGSTRKWILSTMYADQVVCYVALGKFGLAYDALDKLKNIEIGSFTLKPDTIERFQEAVPQLREVVRSAEDEHRLAIEQEKQNLLTAEKNIAGDSGEQWAKLLAKIEEISSSINSRLAVEEQTLKDLKTEINEVANRQNMLKEGLDSLKKVIAAINGKQGVMEASLKSLRSEASESGRQLSLLLNEERVANANLAKKCTSIDDRTRWIYRESENSKKLMIWGLIIVTIQVIVFVWFGVARPFLNEKNEQTGSKDQTAVIGTEGSVDTAADGCNFLF